MAKKALLMILDGWGIGKHDKGDVIFKTPTPYLDYLTAVSAHSTLASLVDLNEVLIYHTTSTNIEVTYL